MKKFLHSKLIRIIISTVAVLALCLFYRGRIAAKLNDVAAIQQSLADSLVRFHVISAGDTEYEQSLKLLVKNSVLELLYDELADVSSKEETLLILEKLTPDILKLARSILAENGCNAAVSANIGKSFFPIKTYGDMTLPAGEYTAFKIIIGEGKGTNWWCVLYPKLCFVDATYGVIPDESKTELKTILAEDEYNTIFGEKVVFRFKFLKFLNKDNRN